MSLESLETSDKNRLRLGKGVPCDDSPCDEHRVSIKLGLLKNRANLILTEIYEERVNSPTSCEFPEV